jgi:hypothetical protein
MATLRPKRRLFIPSYVLSISISYMVLPKVEPIWFHGVALAKASVSLIVTVQPPAPISASNKLMHSERLRFNQS